MQKAQVIDCVSMPTFNDALTEVRNESSVLIIASITEFLVASGDCGTIFSSIDLVLASFVTTLVGFCAFKPTLQAC